MQMRQEQRDIRPKKTGKHDAVGHIAENALESPRRGKATGFRLEPLIINSNSGDSTRVLQRGSTRVRVGIIRPLFHGI